MVTNPFPLFQKKGSKVPLTLLEVPWVGPPREPLLKGWHSSRISLGPKTSQALMGTLDIRLVVERAPLMLKFSYFHSMAWIYLNLSEFIERWIYLNLKGSQMLPLLPQALDATYSNTCSHKERLRSSGLYRHLSECWTTISSTSCCNLSAQSVTFLGTPGCILTCSIHCYPLRKFQLYWVRNFLFQEEITKVLLLLEHRAEQVSRGTSDSHLRQTQKASLPWSIWPWLL